MSLAPQTGWTSPADREPDDEPLGDDDPFRIGTRFVERILPNGESEFDPIPLKVEDLLFPEEYDHPVQNRSHIEDCLYLYASLKFKFADVPDSLVLMDHRVHYDVPDLKPLGPDVALFFEVDEEGEPATFEVAEASAKGALVVEITSPDSRRYDVGVKLQYYHQAGVAYYVVADSRVDKHGARKSVRLFGFRHAPDGYEPIPLGTDSLLWLESLDIGLQVIDNKIMCVDGGNRRVIEPYVEMAQARKAAEAQAQAEAFARLVAEEQARVAEEQARVAEERAESESTARLAAESRAKAETDARLAVEAQLAALHAEILRLKGGDS